MANRFARGNTYTDIVPQSHFTLSKLEKSLGREDDNRKDPTLQSNFISLSLVVGASARNSCCFFQRNNTGFRIRKQPCASASVLP